MSFDPAQAARVIAHHWQAGTKIERLPSSCRPETIEQGYRAQLELPRAMDDAAVGWKIAATSVRGQRHIGVDAPIAGRLLASRVVADGEPVPMQGNRMRVAECEFVFVLGHDLPAREAPYSRDEVADAVAEVRPGLELPDSRFVDFSTAGAAQLAADNACAHWMVIGEPTAARWRELDLAALATRLCVGGVEATNGRGADVLGHPLDALAWLASSGSIRGEGLAAGARITTGVSGAPVPIGDGDALVADLGVLGRVGTVVGD